MGGGGEEKINNEEINNEINNEGHRFRGTHAPAHKAAASSKPSWAATG